MSNSTTTQHYLQAIRTRLEQLYDEHPNDPALREQISDEVDWIEANLAALPEFNEVREALKEAIDVFDGMNDDEINVNLLPRLRAAFNEKGLASHGHGQNRDKTRLDVERALSPKATDIP